jgi:hypothetical protein
LPGDFPVNRHRRLKTPEDPEDIPDLDNIPRTRQQWVIKPGLCEKEEEMIPSFR